MCSCLVRVLISSEWSDGVMSGVDSLLCLRVRSNPFLKKRGHSCDCSFTVAARDGVSSLSGRVLQSSDWDEPLLVAPGSRVDLVVLCSCEDSLGGERGAEEPSPTAAASSVFELYSSVGKGRVAAQTVAYVGKDTRIMESSVLQFAVFATGSQRSSPRASRVTKSNREVVAMHLSQSLANKQRAGVLGFYAQRTLGPGEFDLSAATTSTEESSVFVVENMHACMEQGANGGMFMRHAMNGHAFNMSEVMTKVSTSRLYAVVI